MVVASVLAVTACGTVALRTASAASPVAKCAISMFHVSDSGVVTSKGACKAGAKSVPASWSGSYQRFDSDGNACGTAPTRVPAGDFRVPVNGADHAKVTVTLKARTGRSYPATKAQNVGLGGTGAMCARLGDVSLPPAASICPWKPQGMGPDQKCGVPNGMVSWLSGFTMDGNTVSLGRVASRAGDCYLTSGAIGSFQAPNPPDWLGQHLLGQNLKCADGVFAWANTFVIALVNPAGKLCPNIHYFNKTWSFQVPPNWGGKLYVSVAIGIGYDWRSVPKPVDLETTSASFDLHGTDDGCPAISN